MSKAIHEAARAIATATIPAFADPTIWAEDLPMYQKRELRPDLYPLSQRPIGMARAAVLAFLDEGDEEMRRALGIALWEANYGGLCGKGTDAYQCDPNGCGPAAHAAHQGMERWQESEEDTAIAAVRALRSLAEGKETP